MHDIYLYLRYANSYLLFSDWRTELGFTLQTQFFHKLVCINRRDSRKQEFPKGPGKLGWGGGV